MEKTVGSLFSGIGGIDLAFKQVGYSISWAIENDSACCKTYRHNFHNSSLVEADIRDIDPEKLEKVDVMAAGFPCQSFSVAGKQRGFKDPRGNLFFEVVRFAKVLNPEIIFLENVPNLADHDGGKSFNIIHNKLFELGYYIRYRVLRASEYGNTPQIRDRIYIIAFKDISKCENYKFPDPVLLTKNANHYIIRHERKPSVYYINETDAYYSIVKDTVTRHDCIYRVYHESIKPVMNQMCPTLTASMGNRNNQCPLILDDYGVRKLTLRECLDFQGFPKEYYFPNTISIYDAYKQIGNSVCVSVVRQIASQIKLV